MPGRCNFRSLSVDSSLKRENDMTSRRCTWDTGYALTAALLLPLLCVMAAPGSNAAAEPAKDDAVLPTIPPRTVTLQECLDLALQQHPKLAAQRAGLAAAADGKKAVDSLTLAGLVDHALRLRRKQADLGVTAASARLKQTECEVAYAVTRMYFTVLYARDQEALVQRVVDRLGAIQKAARQAVDAGAADATTADVDRATVYLRLAETRRVEATQGVKRALAALKETVGMEPDCPLDVPASHLPEPAVQPNREQIVAWALSGRGELTQANILAEVACLEVEAQGTTMHKQVSTFAAAADIHAHQVPQEMHNNDYSPGAIPPEMPATLAGSRQTGRPGPAIFTPRQ